MSKVVGAGTASSVDIGPYIPGGYRRKLALRRLELEVDSGTPWLLTFSDLLLLLLTGFVMQLSMGSLDNETLASGLGMSLERRVAIQTASVQIAKEVRKVLTTQLGEPRIQHAQTPILEFPEEIRLQILDQGVAVSLGGGRFLPGRRELSADAVELLNALAPVLRTQEATIKVEGHTDASPIATAEFPSNWELSAARAIEVAQLLEHNGVLGARLSAVGYAETRPVASNSSDDGRAANRRVELLLEPIVKEQ